MKFEHGNNSKFFSGLSALVDDYFARKGIPKTGTPFIVFKGAVFLAIYLGSYAGIYIFQDNYALVILMGMIMGLSAVSIFLNVVHDAAHGVFSRNRKFNTMAKHLGEFIGLNTYIWDIRHNMQHHVFTNIIGGDLFLDNMALVRMTPHHRYRPIHRYQHLYAPFFYMFYTFYWTFVLDFKLFTMKDICNLKNLKHPRKEWIILFTTKLFFIGYMIVAPALLTSTPWYILVFAFLMMQISGGLLGALIGILPHFMEGPTFPVVENNLIRSSWGEHELETSLDFAPSSRLWNWLSGGSNTHVAHHLFPNISQAHYYELTPIIEKYCLENGYPYMKVTIWEGIKLHYRFLRKLGAQAEYVPETVA
jgi:linoleoyl-CoA desaturase